MDFDDIRRVLDLVKEHDLSEFELELEGIKIKVRKTGGPHAVHAPAAAAYAPLPALALQGGGAPAPSPRAAEPRADPGPVAAEDADLAMVTSPIVGTFYRAPQPGAPAFVDKGARVKKGQVLCIIEAMTLMTEIESDHDGEVVAIYAENSRPVQYGERLFAIKVS
jgi:acetyl-CoA carboxylase biotin carboxyl carrier protein